MFIHFHSYTECTARPEDTRTRDVWTSQIHGFALGPNKIKVQVHITQILSALYSQYLHVFFSDFSQYK